MTEREKGTRILFRSNALAYLAAGLSHKLAGITAEVALPHGTLSPEQSLQNSDCNPTNSPPVLPDNARSPSRPALPSEPIGEANGAMTPTLVEHRRPVDIEHDRVIMQPIAVRLRPHSGHLFAPAVRADSKPYAS